MTSRAALLFLLALSSTSVSAAQGVVPAPPHPAPSAVLWQHARADFQSRESHEPLGGFLGPGDEDYRYTGFFIGTGLGGLAILHFLALCAGDGDACSGADTAPMFLGVVGATAMLGLGGAVIGGLISK